jgi:Protein of unknown function (DUF1641)
MDTITSAVAVAPPEHGHVVTDASFQALAERVDSIGRTLDALKPLLALADQAPALLATIGDSADEIARRAIDAGIDLEKGVIQGAGAALRFGATMDAEKVKSIEALLQSGVLDPRALLVMGELGRALAATAEHEPPRMGLGALLKALRRPDIQRALGFLVTFGERFGRGLLERRHAS